MFRVDNCAFYFTGKKLGDLYVKENDGYLQSDKQRNYLALTTSQADFTVTRTAQIKIARRFAMSCFMCPSPVEFPQRPRQFRQSPKPHSTNRSQEESERDESWQRVPERTAEGQRHR